MFKSILVPVDFSEGASSALRLAIKVARANQSDRITLLHVGMAPGVQGLDTWGVAIPATFPELHEQLAKERFHALERLAREEVPDDVPWLPLARDGYAPEEIVAEAATGAYDLLVMGTHGRTGLARAVLGSVTERVLRAVTIPVLVTR